MKLEPCVKGFPSSVFHSEGGSFLNASYKVSCTNWHPGVTSQHCPSSAAANGPTRKDCPVPQSYTRRQTTEGLKRTVLWNIWVPQPSFASAFLSAWMRWSCSVEHGLQRCWSERPEATRAAPHGAAFSPSALTRLQIRFCLLRPQVRGDT